jgi:Beta-ketoacyl synthase, N-terminal domain
VESSTNRMDARPRDCYIVALGCAAPGCRSAAQAHAIASEGDSPPSGARRVDDAALAADSQLPARIAKRMDRFSHLAVAAARSTLADGPPGLDAKELGLVVGNMTGGWGYTEPELRKLHGAGLAEISPYLASAWFPAAAQGQASIQLGMQGWAKTVATDRCAGGQAIGLAWRQVRQGSAVALMAGGAEAPITPFVEAAYQSKFGDPAALREAAAFLVLSARAPEAAQGPAPRIVAHSTRALFADRPLQPQVLELLNTAGRAAPGPLALFVNTMAHARIEDEVAAAVRAAELPLTELRFTNRHFGDALAAAAPLAAVAAAESVRRGQHPTVAVLSVGHQCLDLFFITATDVPQA